MNNIFVIQLVTSFIVGGAVSAAFSFLAEKASPKIAGMIISLPSTAAIGFFFIGWVLSPQKVAEVAPVTPLMLSVIIFFTLTYLFLSKIKLPKILSMILCISGAVSVWFLVAVPVAIFKITNPAVSTLIYIATLLLAFYLLNVKYIVSSSSEPLHYSISQKIFRGFFSGSIISLSVFLAHVSGPFWGAVMSFYPAVFTSTFLIIHWHYDSNFLFRVWKNAPIGSILFYIYGMSAIYTFPHFGIWGGTFVSYALCMLAFYPVSKLNLTKA